MADTLDKLARSSHMSRVRQSGTSCELIVRSLAHRMGYRFRIAKKGLPGTPDLVLPGRRSVIFIHGCFWHRHPGCRRATVPKTNTDFWLNKFAANTKRDRVAIEQLHDMEWRTLVIWECETKNIDNLAERLKSFLDQSRPAGDRIRSH